MIIVTVVALVSWGIFKRYGKQNSIASLLIVSALISFIVIINVRTAGVFREEISPDYDIVHNNSVALFPFVVQKHHNWSSQEYFYQVCLLSQDGIIVYEEGPSPDQSEFMHWSLFLISATLCGLGFFLAVWMIIVAELIWWYRLQGSG
ncbi:MAG: hypothetical protein ACFFF9_13770 [Candidatus Thorarchaeota archaeon]